MILQHRLQSKAFHTKSLRPGLFFFFILLESLQGEPGAFTQAASISGRLQITQAIYLSKRLINTGAAKTQHKKLHALACALAH